MPDLKPCPNPECNDPDPYVRHDREEQDYYVACPQIFCEMQGPRHWEEEKAVRLWNLLPREEKTREVQDNDDG